MPAKLGDPEAECRCGRAGCGCARALDIVVEKGHVRRAIAAANTVSDAATGANGPEAGVVFMTALLLVERLATAFDCEPGVLLARMANCFELKRRHAGSLSRHN